MKKKRYERIFPDEKEELVEMSNLRHTDTGLDHGSIYISSKEGKHGPRVKYYRDRPGSKSASISISDFPEVKEDALGLKSKELKQIIQFILINKKTLLKIWNEGHLMFKDEFNDVINSLNKID
jgi:hypothetical protein